MGCANYALYFPWRAFRCSRKLVIEAMLAHPGFFLTEDFQFVHTANGTQFKLPVKTGEHERTNLSALQLFLRERGKRMSS
ncbi:unnamed protein product [Toxocara canis]|uniref:Secreted protein n=1 Tax=Toxocara canis TaxID=6265 RepID=A0A183TYS4_TOXCA|nr:unnamed protein product [Toxocara canis]